MSDEGIVDLVLRCGECGATERPRVYGRWAPEGCLEIRAGATFYVDGAMVRCPAHTPSDRERKQRFAASMRRLQEAGEL